MSNFAHSFDIRLEHRALASAALTATATIATLTEPAAQRTAYRTLVDIEAIKISANNELYEVIIQLSNDDFATVEQGAVLSLGATEVRAGGSVDNAALDAYEMLWTTQVNGTSYAQWRVRLVASGTSPSITMACHSAILGTV